MRERGQEDREEQADPPLDELHRLPLPAAVAAPVSGAVATGGTAVAAGSRPGVAAAAAVVGAWRGARRSCAATGVGDRLPFSWAASARRRRPAAASAPGTIPPLFMTSIARVARRLHPPSGARRIGRGPAVRKRRSPAGGSIMPARGRGGDDAVTGACAPRSGLERHVLRRERALRLHRARDPGVQPQQRDLHGDDPAEHQPDHQDARAAAQQPVDDPVIGDPAELLEGARAAARRARAAGSARREGPEIRRGPIGAVRGRGRVTVACSGMSALLPELACGPQASRLRSGVGRDLARGGHDRASVHELRLRRVAAHADRQVGRAEAAARLLGEEALDAPVLERMERERGDAAADLGDLPRQRERVVELRARR